MTDLAAALLFESQLKQPLQPKEDPKPRRETRERSDRNDRNDSRNNRGDSRNESRGERAPRKAKVARSDVDWQTYRLEVGKEHGAKPGDIVGAIANEISLDSSYIGAINLHEKHSYVQLPKGMPEKSFKQLKNVRIRRQAIDITVSTDAPAASSDTSGERKRRPERRPS
jgi:ATP-dependent RNA helicase DeaD